MTHFILRISDWGDLAAASVGASLELSGGCVLIVGGVMAKKSKSNYHLHKQLDMFQKQPEPQMEVEKEPIITTSPELAPVVQTPPPPAAQVEVGPVGSNPERTAQGLTAPLLPENKKEQDTVRVLCPQCGGPVAMSINFDHKGDYYCSGACSYGENFYFRV